MIIHRVVHHISITLDQTKTHTPLEVEAEVSEDGSTGQEGAAHAGEQMPVCPIGRAVRLRHMIGLLDHLTVYLRKQEYRGDQRGFIQHLTANKHVGPLQKSDALIFHCEKSAETRQVPEIGR